MLRFLVPLPGYKPPEQKAELAPPKPEPAPIEMVVQARVKNGGD